MQLSELYAGHHAGHRAGLLLQQPHLLLVRRDVVGTAGVLRIAEAIRTALVPLAGDARNQERVRSAPAMDGEVAQAPDGLFLTCVPKDGFPSWERGDL